MSCSLLPFAEVRHTSGYMRSPGLICLSMCTRLNLSLTQILFGWVKRTLKTLRKKYKLVSLSHNRCSVPEQRLCNVLSRGSEFR